jgi:virulence factor Mce-like protein
MHKPARHQGMSPLRAGVIALLVMTPLIYLGFTKDIPFTHGYRIKAVFQTAASEIRTNAQVRIAGVNVGKVKSVKRGPAGTALVEMEIKKDGLPIHTDATMKLRPRLFLEGNFFVDVKPGTSSAPEVKSGGTIPVSQTAIPVQFDQLQSIFDADTRGNFQNVVKGLAASLDRGGAQALADTYDEYAPTFIPLAEAQEAFGGRNNGDLERFIRAQARLAGVLNDRRRDLGELITAFRVTLDAFADRSPQLRETVGGLRKVIDRMPAADTAIDSSLPSLRALMSALRPGLRAAPAVLDDSRPFLRQLAAATAPDSVPAFATELAPGVASLAALNKQLVPLFKLVKPVSDCLTHHVVPVLNMTVPDGELTTNLKVWEEGIRFPVGLSGAQQNFSGDATSTRYSFGNDQNAFVFPVGNSPGELIGVSGQPLVGTRPLYSAGKEPPVNHTSPCEDQALPDLHSPTGPPPANQRRVNLAALPQLTGNALKAELQRVADRLREMVAKRSSR